MSAESKLTVTSLLGCDCSFASLRTAELVDAVPSKMLEALALGVPVVLSAAGESAAVLRASGGGWVCPPGEPKALRSLLDEVATLTPAKRRATGAAGRDHVLAHFRREDAARRLSELLDETVRRARIS